MKLVLLEEAQQRFEEEDAWWRDNRDAKDLGPNQLDAGKWANATAEHAAS